MQPSAAAGRPDVAPPLHCEGEPKQEIRPGDVITCGPGKRHWHGATATTAMTHISIVEPDADGKAVEWLEHVSDAEYLG